MFTCLITVSAYLHPSKDTIEAQNFKNDPIRVSFVIPRLTLDIACLYAKVDDSGSSRSRDMKKDAKRKKLGWLCDLRSSKMSQLDRTYDFLFAFRRNYSTCLRFRDVANYLWKGASVNFLHHVYCRPRWGWLRGTAV